MITIYKNIFSKEPHYLTVADALNRIKNGKSKEQVEKIRKALDKERANELKKNLPSVCFSGKFLKERLDSNLETHSGYIVLDFDDVFDIGLLKDDLQRADYFKAIWLSPSGNGVKALVKIADPKKHKEHFDALKEIYPNVDKSGVNVARVCYESFDAEIFINENPKPFTKIKEVVKSKEVVIEKNENVIFTNILKWLSNKGDAFRTGERNLFIFKLASACCRFGLNELDCFENIKSSLLVNESDFSTNEVERTIKSAYRTNKFGTAQFEKDVLIDKKTSKEIEIDEEIYNLEIKPKDVIYGEDVKADALRLYEYGYESAQTTYITQLDVHFKLKKREITLLSGIGNFGKSTFLKYIMLLQSININTKWALFVPEDFPAHEFYNDLVEMYAGQDCTPRNPNRPSRADYDNTYDWISKHFFFVYPKELTPTPKYIKERFLELIIKEGISGCVIDPFNQMSNDYNSFGGRDDKYLETTLSDFSRFAILNDVLFFIVAHPKMMQKDANGNYKRPSIFDIAGGAMWNNKMDNILIYHRPERGVTPTSTACEITSDKIRRQKVVGIPGTITFEMSPRNRRYFFDGTDYMQICIDAIHKKEEALERIGEFAFDRNSGEVFDTTPF